ncbi:hypothetical protein PRZ48_007404 [Zasmidium cellare]|uniref:Rhodopsin n=1 Tax=Zasmidium cellare TaxID=395010 RepID=A0ABR0EK13_ZASCE|nr:hypothetical protein PRZ48_007404 [Zasmidium cellare]
MGCGGSKPSYDPNAYAAGPQPTGYAPPQGYAQGTPAYPPQQNYAPPPQQQRPGGKKTKAAKNLGFISIQIRRYFAKTNHLNLLQPMLRSALSNYGSQARSEIGRLLTGLLASLR